MKKITVIIDTEIYENLISYAEKSSQNFSEVVRKALAQFLTRHKVSNPYKK